MPRWTPRSRSRPSPRRSGRLSERANRRPCRWATRVHGVVHGLVLLLRSAGELESYPDCHRVSSPWGFRPSISAAPRPRTVAERGACNGRPRLLRSPAEQRRQRHARNRRRPGAWAEDSETIALSAHCRRVGVIGADARRSSGAGTSTASFEAPALTPEAALRSRPRQASRSAPSIALGAHFPRQPRTDHTRSVDLTAHAESAARPVWQGRSAGASQQLHARRLSRLPP